MKKIVLASASPRRRELLEMLGIKFETVISYVDEKFDSSLPSNRIAEELSLIKAAEVYRILADKNAVIIAADTIVDVNGEILGKPKDREDAFSMIKKLSMNEHAVYTGVTVMDGTKIISKSAKTTVRFKPMTDKQINAYIDTGEPMDKAGAYGLQGIGGRFVTGIDGDFFNVVGLPVSLLCDILEGEFNINII